MKHADYKNPNTTRSLHKLLSQLAAMLLTLLPSTPASAQNPTTLNPLRYVNPFIGTGGHGHTLRGATTPFGRMQLRPDARIDGSWDGCSDYPYSASLIYGFFTPTSAA